jgi:dihydroorotate dehydrogenase (NAD+) catalytic subunit
MYATMKHQWHSGLQRFSQSRLARLNIASPFTIPSGIVTTVPSVLARIARDVPEIGFLTTKTVSVAPRPGYREPVIHEYYPGCFVNAVGLANPGAESFVQAMQQWLPLAGDKPLVVSVMGQDPEEFLACARIVQPIADAIELNLSCPHVKGAGQTIGSDPEMVRKVLHLVTRGQDKPVIAKLSPNLPDIAGMARLCEEAGADALCLINTVGPGMACDAEGSPILSNVVGGLSGAGVLPVGVKVVREAAAAVRLPIIAAGGIGNADDVRAYHQAGASLYSVGSALAGMNTVQIQAFFASLIADLEQGPQHHPHERGTNCVCRTTYVKTKVAENKAIGDGMFSLSLESAPPCDPGRFFFLRIPGQGEKPFSPAHNDKPSFLVRTVGPFTSALEKLHPGDDLFLRGPYGKGFPQPLRGKRLVLVGGGTGAAPLLMAADAWPDRIRRAFFGFSRRITDDFRQDILSRIPEAHIVIDPPDRVGEVIRLLIEDMAADPTVYEEAQAFLCGPSVMMKLAAEVLASTVSPDLIFMGREDIMRCGIGLCGSCGTETGLRSCVDGPVIPLEIGTHVCRNKEQ